MTILLGAGHRVAGQVVGHGYGGLAIEHPLPQCRTRRRSARGVRATLGVLSYEDSQ